MTLFITSDTHFGHANVIQYCNRPFVDVATMNNEIIRRWNSVVAPTDEVYHLGDFFMGPRAAWEDIFKQLNGQITLVLGNHDYPGRKRLKHFAFQDIVKQIEENWTIGQQTYKILFQHHPLPLEQQDPYDIVLCGHVHEKWIKRDKVINVGCDVWDFTPQTLQFIVSNADQRQAIMDNACSQSIVSSQP